MSRLVLFSALEATTVDGEVDLTRKFVDGMRETLRGWPGPITCVHPVRTRPSTNLDHVSFRLRELPFDVALRKPEENVDALLRDAALVQIGHDYRHIDVARRCRALRVPYVVVTEYNLRTRIDCVIAEESSSLERVKRTIWECLTEASELHVMANAHGLQCNGTPTFESYGPLNRAPLLYFDTRARAEDVAGDELVIERHRNRTATLRLAFSGRLIPMKGALALLDLAVALRRRAVPFSLRVFGDGPLYDTLREHRDLVSAEGVLEFSSLLETLQNEVDVFVCPHPQGDPSCTYLETLACGVPIAGFANEAWRGVLERSGAGWSVPVGDVEALANVVAEIAMNREEILERSLNALAFAREHTFESEFAKRTRHLRTCGRRLLA